MFSCLSPAVSDALALCNALKNATASDVRRAYQLITAKLTRAALHAVKSAQQRAQSMLAMCSRLHLPLAACAATVAPATPLADELPDHEDALSNLLTAAQAASHDDSAQLAASLQIAAGELVCGADMLQAQRSIFADYVASQLQRRLGAGSSIAKRAGPLQPVHLLPRQKQAAIAELSCTAAFTAAWQECMRNDSQACAASAYDALPPRQDTSILQAAMLRTRQAHLQTCMRMHAGVLQRAQRADPDSHPWHESATTSICGALSLPALPARMGVNAVRAPASRLAKRSGARQHSKRAVAEAAPDPAQAWAHEVLTAAGQHSCWDVGVVLLTTLAAHLLAPELHRLSSTDELIACSSTAAAASAMKSHACSVLLACAVLSAQAAVPHAVPALQGLATHAAALQQPELAHCAAVEALSLANRSAAMLQSLQCSLPDSGAAPITRLQCKVVACSEALLSARCSVEEAALVYGAGSCC